MAEKKDYENVFDLKLYEETYVKTTKNGYGVRILRVPGGWIHMWRGEPPVFVPLSYQDAKKN